MVPMVSVVVATYRREEALERALQSLAEQTYLNYEIVLVDDNANEAWNQKVGAIVEAFRKAHPDKALRYFVNSPNKGSAVTRNIGIQAADGTYVTFLDDDDVYLPEKIAQQVACMEEKGADYGVTNLDLYYDDEVFCERRTRGYIENTDYTSLMRCHMLHHLTGTDTMMFRREYLLKIGGFDPIDVGDEFYLMLKAIESKGVFAYLDRSDVKAYVHRGEGGLSSGESKINGENLLFEFKKKYFHLLNKKDIRFVKARHYAVIAFAEIRRKGYGAFVKNAAMAFAISPIDCLKLLRKNK
jgi:glycosyltransferase involved in cell wall biosynthesis